MSPGESDTVQKLLSVW
jgi:hypothetical protein